MIDLIIADAGEMVCWDGHEVVDADSGERDLDEHGHPVLLLLLQQERQHLLVVRRHIQDLMAAAPRKIEKYTYRELYTYKEIYIWRNIHIENFSCIHPKSDGCGTYKIEKYTYRELNI